MMGTMFCQYETPCGWCVRLNKECPEKLSCKSEIREGRVATDQREKLAKENDYELL